MHGSFPIQSHLDTNSLNIFTWPKHKLVCPRTTEQETILVAQISSCSYQRAEVLCLCALTFTLLQSLLHFMVCYGLMQTIGFAEISGEETGKIEEKDLFQKCWGLAGFFGAFFFFSLVKAAWRLLFMLIIPEVGQLFKRGICF